MTVLALTGATGFVGGHVLDAAWEQGCRVRALTRREQPSREGVTWIGGDLASRAALDELCRGADAVIHVAGAINAAERATFDAVNVEGTRRTLAAAEAAGVRRLVHVSSLAAREPALSAYGASKFASEAVVEASVLDWTIVRPPAVYGPGDRELLELFRVARSGFVPIPGSGRISLIAGRDLADLLVTLALVEDSGATLEPDDGCPRTQAGLAPLLAGALGRSVRPVPIPRPLLALAALADGRIPGPLAKLTADRVSYFSHPDWAVDPAKRPPAELWAPRVPAEAGFAETAAWYRARSWL